MKKEKNEDLGTGQGSSKFLFPHAGGKQFSWLSYDVRLPGSGFDLPANSEVTLLILNNLTFVKVTSRWFCQSKCLSRI